MTPRISRLKLLLTVSGLAVALTLVLIYYDNQRLKHRNEQYQIPDVTLIRHDGAQIQLREYLRVDKPLILEFIYTGCTTVCPQMMIKFSNFQRRLETDTGQVLLVSISIDPENDTPEVLNQYRERYQAMPGWDFLTGSVSDIRKVMDAFATTPTDMATLDTPLLLRAPGSQSWLRLTGKIDNQTLWNAYQQIASPTHETN